MFTNGSRINYNNLGGRQFIAGGSMVSDQILQLAVHCLVARKAVGLFKHEAHQKESQASAKIIK